MSGNMEIPTHSTTPTHPGDLFPQLLYLPCLLCSDVYRFVNLPRRQIDDQDLEIQSTSTVNLEFLVFSTDLQVQFKGVVRPSPAH